MKKRYVALFACALLLGTIFAGCGTSSSTSNSSSSFSSSASQESSSTSGSSSSSGSSSTDASDIDTDFELITDWEDAATITISGSSVTIDGEGAEYTDGVILISGGGAYTITGSSTEVSILVNSSKDVKLILDGVDLSVSLGPVIYGYDCDSLYIELADGSTNSLSDGSTYETDDEGNSVGKGVICCNDDIVLVGTGSATITANYKHGIVSDDSLCAVEGTYDITVKGTDGLHANDLLAVYGGSYTIDAASDCLQSEAILIIYGGTITGNSSDEGIEGKTSIQIDGGTISLSVKDDGLNAGSTLVINGGDIYIHCTTGDAIDSNGTIEINGGYIVAYGGGSPEGGLDCDNASVVINGGTVIAVGDANSSISTSSEQVSVLLGQYTAGSTISITDSDGNEVISFTLDYSQSNIIVSCDGFEEGETYTVYSNGSESVSFTVSAQVVSAGGSSSSIGGGNTGGMGSISGSHKS